MTTKYTKITKGDAAWNLSTNEESFAVVGACFEVFKEMGCGFLEAVYQECLGIEFELSGIPFREQSQLSLIYKQKPLKQ